MDLYIEPRDVWVGWYRDKRYHYICVLPCVVLRVKRHRRDR